MTVRPKAKYNLGSDSNNAKGTKADVLKMVLRHGDLVVMHGTGIQKLYEVCSLSCFMLKSY
jgi:alkylated DNA repair dioxygenase AlkB